MKADAAGDTDSAKVLAAEVRRLRATAPSKDEPSPLDKIVARPDVNYNPAIGSIESAMSLGSGMAGAVAGGISGLATTLTNAAGLTNTPPSDRVHQVQDAMTFQPRTEAGKLGTRIATYLPEKVAEFGDFAGGKATDLASILGASPELAANLGTQLNVGVQALPAMLGRVAGATGGAESPAAAASRAKLKSLNEPVDKGIAAARDGGLAITPTQANAGMIPKAIESLAGSARLEKMASTKNAPVINKLIRKDVGLADDVPITRDALAKVREEAGKAYDDVKNAGEVVTDAKYKADLAEITKSYDTSAKSFAHRAENPFQKTLDGLRTDKFDAASAVEEIKLLRGDADKAFRSGDKTLGRAYRQAAEAMDDMLDRHLSASGNPQAVAAYKEARVRIAKTYAADKALNDSTGNINAGVYAREMKRGKPLTGEAETVARFGEQFPKSAQAVERAGATGPTAFDAMLGVLGGVGGAMAHGAMGGGVALPLALARPATRAALMSGPLQRSLTTPPNYGIPLKGRLAELLSDTDAAGGAGFTAAGQR